MPPHDPVPIPHNIDQDDFDQIMVDNNIDYCMDEGNNNIETCQNWDFACGIIAALVHTEGPWAEDSTNSS